MVALSHYMHYILLSVFQWSYGITLWEIYSEGCTPYAFANNEDIEQLLARGERLQQPEKATQKM